MKRWILWSTGWRYLLRRPWQSVLMVVGVALGVAVVVAVDLANASASRAFDLSTQAVTGKATHQVVGGPLGLDEALYTRLRKAGLGISMAPALEEYVSSPQLGNRLLQLLGIDPFAEAPFRNYLAGGYGGNPSSVIGQGAGDLSAFLTQPGAVLLSQDLAQSFSLSVGTPITIEVGGLPRGAIIVGLLQPSDSFSRRALDGLILADISTAQEMTGRLGRLDHIDLIIPADNDGTDAQRMDRLQALLGSEARLETVAARQGSVAQMIDAFRVNLTALSLLALIVGMFLIYNTITFSVLQRRPLFGTLRCLGVTRAEIFALVLGEALLVGVLGAASGVLLGVLMGQGAIRLVTQTINDLFFVVSVRGVQVPTLSLLKGGVAGILAAALSAAPPAWEAAAVPPRQALSRSGLESKARRVIILAALAGLGLVLVGWGVLALPSRNLLLSFGGTSAVVVGFALLVPLLTRLLMQATALLMSRIGGVLGRMAPRDVVNSLSRTSIAVMALMVAVSVTIGVSLMVDSFRNTVITWLGETLQGDVYISGPSLVSTTPTTPIDPGIIEVLRGWPGITRLDMLRSVEVDSPQGSVHVSATNNYSVAQERLFLSTSIPVGQIWERMSQGGVLVSEPFANRFTLPHKGGSVILYTNDGPRTFPLLGIYYDYASTQGTVLMALPIYQQAWQDRSITSISLRLIPGVDVDRVVRDLQNKLSGGQQLVIRANSSLRQDVLQVFDRTFAITGALQLLATMVAFIGVLSALLSLELERQREFGILRSVGMTARQVWALILAETGLLGACAGLLAMPTGYALALILVYIINRRSFGWTLQMQVEARPFVEALAVALVAALLAGLYPAWRMGRMVPSEALRTE